MVQHSAEDQVVAAIGRAATRSGLRAAAEAAIVSENQ